MNKPKFETPNLTAANIAKLAELFPAAVSEGKVNFDLLRTLLGDEVFGDEAYEFTWVGKRAAIAEAGRPTRKTLRPCVEESKNWDTTENLYIEGDNLDVLKLLQESYLGKVKMIYIDPPYNTGNDFIYRDDFKQSRDEYDEEAGIYDEDGDRLFRNTESNGRFHSDWCCMMYPRLVLARNLLSPDGVIFISIDDGEVAQLRKICDEVFGGENFKSCISWQKRYTRSNNTVEFTTVVEYLLVYSKTPDFVVNLLSRTEDADNRYTNPDNDPRGPWKGASFLNPATPAERPNLCYSITNPNTGAITNPTTNAWRRSKEVFEELQRENKLYWGIDGKQNVPSIKMFLSEARGLTPINLWSHEYAGNTDQGTLELAALLEGKYFNNPKPSMLVKRALEHSSVDGAIILDFFSGSATTAHAVMQLNAEDGGRRKFIMVQLPEVCAEGTEAAKVGYKNICEIGKERIRRAGAKIQADISREPPKRSEACESLSFFTSPMTTAELDTGFRVLKLDETNMKDVYYAATEYTQDLIALMESNIKDDRTDMDLLFGCLLDWGLPLSMPHTHEVIDGATVHTYNNGDLIACFADKISDTVVRAIAERRPLRAVFRDSSFTSSPEKINVKEIFKLLSPNTSVKVI